MTQSSPSAASPDSKADDPVPLRHRELERIAMVTLKAGKLLMESGARARAVHDCGSLIALGLGAKDVGFRLGYASLEITVAAEGNTITRMMPVGRLGVNRRLDLRIRRLSRRIGSEGMSPEDAAKAVDALLAVTPRYSPFTTALAVGVACASFGRLFGMDWMALPPVLAAAAVAQYGRHRLLHAGFNMYVVTAFIALLSSSLAGWGSLAVGSETADLAMTASILLLVPGVPATNAQADIMDGYPTLGSARAISVMMVMIFATTGLWLSRTLVGAGT